MTDTSTPMLKVRGLRVRFPTRQGTVTAVDGVSFDLEAGGTLGLVGESGCGKTTLGRAVLRLVEPGGGRVVMDGQDITVADRAALKHARRQMQIVFQDPFASLSPRRCVLQIVREPLDVHKVGSRAERVRTVHQLLETVGLPPDAAGRYPHEFSGGQRQRIAIARALALKPRLIVADEATSALDVSVKQRIIELMARLQTEFGIAYLFISHDLAVVRRISHRVAVMYLGKLVEVAQANALYADPRHPYTRALLSAVPKLDPAARKQRIILPGDVPSPINPPGGCPFHPRCPAAMAVCREKRPPVVDVGTKSQPHHVRCHLYA